ncbi:MULTISPECIES: bifunctional 4-hydroxy-2-oxoglutarate aldolase/2-dehydro-3-deoxy-phosphogluconate aldolase [Bacillaceae]|jgi:2-dehydro-3-deoxyphosphogluconate aldolase/(4S)-4-hydroxy-2-oxoglutarate aldolase|uniref:Bifunctional 4-hydroxy-2-oxoglutarate aldolase/2-dehydro-3-deoxy-phosphogluconate aldolase n=1 Tax=Cytobacillus firmus TaxID=1399 RepID=A0AA46P4Z4_CYTFI|nr:MULTISPECIES: bifunctional 4-hydroxy-2-oxoglutarate aldolase/2-dehydro-3-deoxy-phosphogluconate aldolase [Bacillaceae]MCC3649554.1 bifunctional 4-hydroxy-2-oxoglutarate aldolase/2-dehydro-3-deoxy-phosphogluconate aldolase [Cytobacillus oceanisediminis]MCS0656099.1 bifunctional 4-hydroxy-2-oxoglutarate aldolase/2-dehydro-3-deoxy-phosphogluconate aldolase [Cytobacillus firmus]MCU1808426.1 bifunctional 4-hydroxy-2-oxoglutarate aldolase/2-dehydro-3-deoxy-phosphogluconate aldolase [Cytobacillus fi
MQAVDFIKAQVIVAVIREATAENIVPIASALYDGGVKVLEVTAETPGVMAMIEKVRVELGDKVLVGAGTVLDPETARAAIMAGSQFIVSPSLNTETIKMTKRYGIASIPGALTPTEILTAYENGADMIKVFPANAFGPGYIKNIHGPFPHIPLMVTGGINESNMQEYIEGGALAIGVGGNLVNPKNLNSDEDYLTLTKKALEYTALLNK